MHGHLAVLQKAGEQNVTNLKKGIDSGANQAMTCSATPFADARGAIYNPKNPAKHCTRSVADSAGVRHMHIACNDFENEYERIDAEHFKGTTQLWATAADPNDNGDRPSQKQTTTFTAKWISEMRPHLPYSPPMTDLDGVRPKGPYAVGWLDPVRLVAEIEGRQFIAQQAFLLINNVTVGTAENYGPALSDVFQNIYMHYAVAATAVHLHLDQQQPWKSRLDAGVSAGYNADRFRKFDADPARFTRYSTEWNQVVNRSGPGADANSFSQMQDALWNEQWTNLLWDAYFSQYKTKGEKDAALAQLKEKYKLTILDADFFAGTRRD